MRIIAAIGFTKFRNASEIGYLRWTPINRTSVSVLYFTSARLDGYRPARQPSQTLFLRGVVSNQNVLSKRRPPGFFHRLAKSHETELCAPWQATNSCDRKAKTAKYKPVNQWSQ